MNTHTQDHYKAAIKTLADERKDCKHGEHRMSAHTPGPWTSEPPPSSLGACRWIRSEQDTIALVGYKDFSAGQAADIANAALIAKAPIAPKLAEALHALVNAIYREYPEKVPFYCRTEVESAMDRLTEWDAQS